jgi:thiol:disulfide interchange protein
MSPGLALILDWVTTLSTYQSIFSYIQGFLLLFIFGIGSSFPLLIIGTFSSAINILPSAGSWMIEIKNIIGIMLILISFYHLYHIYYIPKIFVTILLILFLIFLSLFYIKRINNFDSYYSKSYKYIAAFILFSTALYISYFTILTNDHLQVEKIEGLDFQLNYKQALDKANVEDKNIFIDISSTYCMACKSLYKKIFLNDQFKDILNKKFILLKVDEDINVDDFSILKDLFGNYIKKTGFPTLLIIDKNQNVLKHFGIEIIDNLDKFKLELESL